MKNLEGKRVTYFQTLGKSFVTLYLSKKSNGYETKLASVRVNNEYSVYTGTGAQG